MYVVTIRPIGLVNNTPKLHYLKGWVHGIWFSWQLYTAIKDTYGKHKLVESGIPNMRIVRTKTHGDVATLELDEVSTDTNIKGALNGA